MDGPATDHNSRAEALRRRVTGSIGETDAALRRAIMARTPDGPPLPPPYGALVDQIRDAAAGVTDQQVAGVRAVAGSDKAAFEVIVTAAVASGLRVWDCGIAAIEAADDASR